MWEVGEIVVVENKNDEVLYNPGITETQLRTTFLYEVCHPSLGHSPCISAIFIS